MDFEIRNAIEGGWYLVKVTDDGEESLGRFDSILDAAQAYAEARDGLVAA